jgi:SAM-dependent methyltransferase
MSDRKPNRVLDLQELELPEFQRVLQEMDELVSREDVSYLHPSKRWEYPWALERAALTKGSRVLDAGCGASIFPIYLAAQGYRVTAADLKPPVRLDRLHGLSVDYVAGDLTNLPLADEAFNAVFCISAIEHLPVERMLAATKELRRVLRTGGRLLVTTDYYKDSSAELWYQGPGKRFRVDWSFFDEAALRARIMEAPGFSVEGDVDLRVDWESISPRMLQFHGYPYTSVGITLVKV